MSGTIRGATASRKRLRQRASRLRGESGTLYPQLAKMLSDSTKKNFNAGGREPTWPKRKGTYSHPILDKTGRMRDTLEITALGPWQVNGTQHLLKVWGPEYTLYHHYQSKNLPIRKTVKPTDAEKTKLSDRIRKEWNIK